MRIALVVAVPAFSMAAATARRSRSATEVWLVGQPEAHHGSSARSSPTGGERLCGEGRRPHQRVLRRHYARRGTATAPSAGRGATPGVAPVREVGMGWHARRISFFLRSNSVTSVDGHYRQMDR